MNGVVRKERKLAAELMGCLGRSGGGWCGCVVKCCVKE